jgi:hypothetical protein
MKTQIKDGESIEDPETTEIPAPSFSLEAFRNFLSRKLREVLDTLLEWGDAAARKLGITPEKLDNLRREIQDYFFDFKRMHMPLGH